MELEPNSAQDLPEECFNERNPASTGVKDGAGLSGDSGDPPFLRTIAKETREVDHDPVVCV